MCFLDGEPESTNNYARKVADHYSARSNKTLKEREASPIIHLKKLNNWVRILISFAVLSIYTKFLSGLIIYQLEFMRGY